MITITALTLFFVLGVTILLSLGIFVGYFSYKIHRLHERIERIATVLAQAGPNIAARIQEGSTKVVLNDAWNEELDDTIITR